MLLLSVILRHFLLFLSVIQCLLPNDFLCHALNGLESGGQNGAWSLSDDSWNYWWSYSGVSGPAYWGLLNLDWFMCDKGRRQSPINIDTNSLVYDPHLTPLHADNNLISGLLYNDGHAIVFNCTTPLSQYQKPLKQNNNHQQQPEQPLIQAINSSSPAKRRSVREEAKEGSFTHEFLFTTGTKEDNLINALQNAAQLTSDSIQMSIDEGEKLNLENENIMSSQDKILAENADPNLESTLGQGEQNDEISPTSAERIEFHGAGLAYTYKFETLTLRFSLDSRLGSEHQINSRSYTAEVQLLAYNSFLYKSYSMASTKPDGLLGIAIFVEPLNEEPTTRQQMKSVDQNNQKQTDHQPIANEQLEMLLTKLDEIKNRGSSTLIRDLNLTALLPDTNYFVTYQGSLTVPGCQESVTWLVLNKPLYMRRSRLDALRSISAAEPSNTPTGNLIAGNIRPTQPVNDRPIRTNIRPSPHGEGQETCQRLWTRYEYKQAL